VIYINCALNEDIKNYNITCCFVGYEACSLVLKEEYEMMTLQERLLR
jgi:hypothetical protein